jgi:hypothetical protein
LELTADFLVGEAATVHLQNVASSRDGLVDRGEVGIESRGGNGECRQAVQWRILTCQVEFALQVRLDDLDIAQGHADVFVPERLHESRKADAQTDISEA